MPEKSFSKLQTFGDLAGKLPLEPEILFFPSQCWSSGIVGVGRLGKIPKLILPSESSGLKEGSSGWNGAKGPSMCWSYWASRLQEASCFTPWGSWTWATSPKKQTSWNTLLPVYSLPLTFFPCLTSVPLHPVISFPTLFWHVKGICSESSPKQVKRH